MMHIVLCLLGIYFLGGAAFIAVDLMHAPFGYEGENGFHYVKRRALSSKSQKRHGLSSDVALRRA